nr:hypothetical protein RKHAN_02538 [Rhizobium sp. Khangiran2]
MYYGIYNSHADLDRGNHGFSNTWDVVRFHSKADRDEFLRVFENKKSEAVTRSYASAIWKNNFECVGKDVPKGGLFNGETFWSHDDGFMGLEWDDIKPQEERVDEHYDLEAA